MTQLPSRILVPTDFSPAADTALALATRLAARFSAPLHLLHVQVLLDDPHLPEGDQEQLEALRAQAAGLELQFKALAEQIGKLESE